MYFSDFFSWASSQGLRTASNKNENRNIVLQYAVDNPGSTLREVSRGLHMNLGTVRYHMFILELNHRLVSYRADNKHVRYFINSNSYSKEEQLAISLLRRDGIKRILGLLIENPRLTNLELSNELQIQESAVSRYMKELSDKGIVDRETADNGMGAYFVKSEHRQAIASMMERVG